MREIKFRGLNRPTNEWKYGYLVVDEKYTQIWQQGDDPVPVDYKTVGQYLGFKDEAGTEVFEGDVLQYSAKNRGTRWSKRVIAKYGMKSARGAKVVGNIHLNPELIKGKIQWELQSFSAAPDSPFGPVVVKSGFDS